MKTHINQFIPTLNRKQTDSGLRVYETPEGKVYPSVTSVTSLESADGIAAWRRRVGEEEAERVSARASARGTRIHKLCEDELMNCPSTPNMFDKQMFDSMKPWLDCIDNVRCVETALYSNFLQVAGTVDCIADFQGRLSVIDFKTASRPKDRGDIFQYFMQTAAYSVAYEEMTGIPIGYLVIIMGVDNDEPRLFIEKRDTWIAGFRKLRLEYRNKHGI